MENATKAMLIAGAILMVIVLIAFGLIIFNSTSNSAQGAHETSEGVTNATNFATSAASSAVTNLDQWIK